MLIKPEYVHCIAIKTTEKPVDFARFEQFIQKSPFVRRVAFIGKAIFDMPDFPKFIEMCATNNIDLIFGEMGEISDDNVSCLVKHQNVLFINMYENDTHIKQINDLKQQLNVKLPDIKIIQKNQQHYPQDEISPDSYAFFNLADNIDNIECLNLLKEPMINYDGTMLGCWRNPDKTLSVNAFDLGMDKTLNHPTYKHMLHMLKTLKINLKSPCARCPIFTSLIWTNKKLDICKKLFVS